jgi:hypothetical protein
MKLAKAGLVFRLTGLDLPLTRRFEPEHDEGIGPGRRGRTPGGIGEEPPLAPALPDDTVMASIAVEAGVIGPVQHRVRFSSPVHLLRLGKEERKRLAERHEATGGDQLGLLELVRIALLLPDDRPNLLISFLDPFGLVSQILPVIGHRVAERGEFETGERWVSRGIHGVGDDLPFLRIADMA